MGKKRGKRKKKKHSPEKAPTAFLISSALSTSVIAILQLFEQGGKCEKIKKCFSHHFCSYDQSCSAVWGRHTGRGWPRASSIALPGEVPWAVALQFAEHQVVHRREGSAKERVWGCLCRNQGG